METAETPHHSGGIVNYFNGATIKNLVINGNMHDSGHSYNTKKNTKNIKYTEEQIAEAISNINGEGKALDSKQKWAGVYWYLRWAQNYPANSSDFCKKMDHLPFVNKLEFECAYRNIRELTTLSFMDQDARHPDDVIPSRNDSEAYLQCRSVAVALAQELQQISNSD